MPELPEVETLRRALESRVRGRIITAVRVHDTRLRRRVDAGRLRRLLTGRSIRRLERRGKYLLLRLAGDVSLVVHLGMSGTLRIRKGNDDLDRHEHVQILLRDRNEVRYHDPRRFGMVHVLQDNRLDGHPDFRDLGVEPLTPALTPEYLDRTAGHRRAPVKNVLLDQHVLAGLGNIYACESLHRARIHPKRQARRLSITAWSRLEGAIRQVLTEAIRARGTTLRDHEDGHGRPGGYAAMLSVYGRGGEACPRCGGTIRCIRLAGRSTYYCGRCQH